MGFPLDLHIQCVMTPLFYLSQTRSVLEQRERRSFNTSTTSLMEVGEEGDWEISLQEVCVYIHVLDQVFCMYMYMYAL